MPLHAESLDRDGEPVATRLDARWLMAYAAGLGHADACYFDTTRGIVAHPLFPVCFEWPVFLATHGLPGAEHLTAEERLRGVHATHELLLHRPIRPDDELVTRARVVGLEQRRPGAYQVVRLDTRDASGEPVCTTWYGSLYRGVGIEGDARPAPDLPEPPGPQPAEAPRHEEAIPIAANAAHVYTECARIWNPIHTDAAVAARAGLPGIILHGTATLALAVSRLVECECGGDPTRVTRVSARFAAMVPMPSKITLAYGERAGSGIRFEVRNASGEAAIRDGLLVAR